MESVDTTLESLAISDVSLGFQSGQTSYSVQVGNSVERVTVTAIATVEIGANVSIGPSDSDADMDGHQVDLDVGNNNIYVSVLDEFDSSYTMYYVQVTRAG